MSIWQKLFSTFSSKIQYLSTISFSDQIPPELHKRIENHIAKTGESKQQLFINALNSYLNYSVNQQNTPIISSAKNSLIEERFNALSDRVAELELSLNKVSSQNSEHVKANINKIDISDIEITSHVLSDTEFIQQDEDSAADSSNDTVALEVIITQNNQNGQDVGSEQQEETTQTVEDTPAKFENLTSTEMAKETGLKQSQLDTYKRKLTIKFQKMGQPLEAKKLLPSPEKVDFFEPILIDSYHYDLFYLGQNDKGNNLWTALPCHGFEKVD